MKKRRGKILIFLLIFSISLGLLSPFSMALADERVLSGPIPVKITLSGTPPEVDEKYEVFLKAEDKAFPMPVGSKDGLYSITIKGKGAGQLPEIEFSSLGVYTYNIWMKSGDNELASYDKTEYKMVVYITRSEEDLLESTVLLFKEGEKETNKYDEVEFIVDYQKPEEPPKEKEPPKKEEKPKLPSTGEMDSKNILFLGVMALALSLGLLLKRNRTLE